mgnify:CR=1 FL=1
MTLCKQARKKAGLTQVKFAKLTQIPVSTIQDGEREARKPGSAAITLLRLINHNPVMLKDILSGLEKE